MKKVVILSLLTLLLNTGCAGLMMDVKDIDQSAAHLTLAQDAPAQVAMPAFELAIEDEERGKEVAEMLRGNILAQLEEKGIAVSDSAEQKISVKLTNYKKGCGFCRGFFPVFGLGNSAVDGEATLTTPSGSRTLVIQKTGQTRGITQMGDQTDDNTQYFAKVLVSNLLKDGSEADNEEEKEE